jgi:hypothetical protein
MIKGKSAEEIRRTFNITNDFTPEEEAQIKKENVSLLTIFICTKNLTISSIRNGPRIVKLIILVCQKTMIQRIKK